MSVDCAAGKLNVAQQPGEGLEKRRKRNMTESDYDALMLLAGITIGALGVFVYAMLAGL